MRRAIVVAALAALLPIGGAIPAAAGDGGEEERTREGRCSGSASWKLKVKPDDGRLEVEAEIDSSVRGQRWRWRITHNASVSARGRATTAGSSGSFEVERRMSDLGGTDRFRLRATSGGQVCRGRISW